MTRTILILIVVSILLAGCITDQPAEKGTLQLTSSPAGAEIYLDYQYRGSTPGTIPEIEPGNHTLEYRLTGYETWKGVITVPPGRSNYGVALSARPVSQQPADTGQTAAVPATITVLVGRERMIVGDTNTFSGIYTGTGSVVLTLLGPGYYANGIVLDQVKPGAASIWSFTWNPGTKIQSGTYTIVASNAETTISDRVSFVVIGHGEVTVIPSTYAARKGETITLSGRCTTGALNVELVLFGPERYAGGVSLGTFSVIADETWSYRYTTDSTMPTGTYTVYASDVPKTASGSSQFTIGYAS